MKTNQTFGMILGLALGLAYSVSAQPGGAGTALGGAAKNTEALILDFSKYPMEKFVTDGETNRLWQSLAFSV
jgi:hypothetical protein